MRGRATALVGAQFGSEGKGMVAAALAGQFDTHVRTGGPNAGHTFWIGADKFVARSLPCGWVNPEASLYIGPGAVLDFDVFSKELLEIEDRHDPQIAERLTVDHRASVVTHAQHVGEGGVEGRAHREIGSTGEGVGLARMARINRDTLIPPDAAPFKCVRVEDLRKDFAELGVAVEDVSATLCREISFGAEVLLEGTQGYGLSLTLGPWPYCTSADTNAAQLAADAGISPSDVRETILVARTFPIRVAGSSGPLWNETSWADVGQPPEITTVTRKERRVGRWNPHQIEAAIRVNNPALPVITFLDYLYPEAEGIVNWRALPADALAWLLEQEKLLETRIVGVGTGPDSYCPIGQLGIMKVEVTYLDDAALPPVQAYGGDAGWDLMVLEPTWINVNEGKDVRTGIAVAIPEGYFGRIVGRSSALRKRGLMVIEGIIDCGFRGELFSYVFCPPTVRNVTTGGVQLKPGDSVAQLIVHQIPPVEWVEVETLLGIGARAGWLREFRTMKDLEAWWISVATKDYDAMAPKIEEYGGAGGGSADLRVMGDALAELCGMHDAPDAVKQELACWFYALGKISRLISDYQQGKPGKPDSWHDLTVYSMMARRLQEHGRWP